MLTLPKVLRRAVADAAFSLLQWGILIVIGTGLLWYGLFSNYHLRRLTQAQDELIRKLTNQNYKLMTQMEGENHRRDLIVEAFENEKRDNDDKHKSEMDHLNNMVNKMKTELSKTERLLAEAKDEVKKQRKLCKDGIAVIKEESKKNGTLSSPGKTIVSKKTSKAKLEALL